MKTFIFNSREEFIPERDAQLLHIMASASDCELNATFNVGNIPCHHDGRIQERCYSRQCRPKVGIALADYVERITDKICGELIITGFSTTTSPLTSSKVKNSAA